MGRNMNRDIISIQMKLLSLPLTISTTNVLSFTLTVELEEEEMFFFYSKNASIKYALSQPQVAGRL